MCGEGQGAVFKTFFTLQGIAVHQSELSGQFVVIGLDTPVKIKAAPALLNHTGHQTQAAILFGGGSGQPDIDRTAIECTAAADPPRPLQGARLQFEIKAGEDQAAATGLVFDQNGRAFQGKAFDGNGMRP